MTSPGHPRRHRRAAALCLAAGLTLAACGGESEPPSDLSATETSTDTETSQPSPEPSDTATENDADGDAFDGRPPVVIAGVDFDAGVATLRNAGDTDETLTGWWICNRPAYRELPEVTIPAGGTVEVDLTGIATNRDTGELALYTSGSFGNAEDLVAYVHWGAATHGRTGVAVEAGRWTEGDVITNDGQNFSSTADLPTSSADYEVG